MQGRHSTIMSPKNNEDPIMETAVYKRKTISSLISKKDISDLENQFEKLMSK